MRNKKKDGARFDMFQYFASNKAKCVVEESSGFFLQTVDSKLWMMKVDRTAEKMSCLIFFFFFFLKLLYCAIIFYIFDYELYQKPKRNLLSFKLNIGSSFDIKKVG